MIPYDYDLEQEVLAHWAAIDEVEDVVVEHLMAEARRRGHHDQRRRNAHRHDGPHEWYPRPESHRVEEVRDTRRATRADMAMVRRDVDEALADRRAQPDDEGDSDFGPDVTICAGAALYRPVEVEDFWGDDWYGDSSCWPESSTCVHNI